MPIVGAMLMGLALGMCGFLSYLIGREERLTGGPSNGEKIAPVRVAGKDA